MPNKRYNTFYEIYVCITVILLSRRKITQRGKYKRVAKELYLEVVNVSTNPLYYYIR